LRSELTYLLTYLLTLWGTGVRQPAQTVATSLLILIQESHWMQKGDSECVYAGVHQECHPACKTLDQYSSVNYRGRGRERFIRSFTITV